MIFSWRCRAFEPYGNGHEQLEGYLVIDLAMNGGRYLGCVAFVRGAFHAERTRKE